MSPEDREKILRAYRRLEYLLRKHLPFKRGESIRANVHITLHQSRFSFECAWDEDEDAHLQNSDES